jgi:hypothetical protein
MAGSRTLKLSILADVDNLRKELNKGEKEVEGFGGKLEKFSAAAKAAFVAAAAAAAAYAGKLAIEGVKAAIEDEAAQKRLANALANVTGATKAQIAAVEEQILKTSLATGVADDQLRPALQRLAIATGDVTKANDLLTLALDISAATGKDVETVSQALGKAYEGNTGSLTRLGVGLSTTEIKTLGLEGAITTLTDTFGGAAKTQSETFEGRIQRLQVAFDEAKESVGAALLPIIEKLLKFITDKAIPAFETFKINAIDPVIKAFKDNEHTIRGFFNFFKDTILPFIIGDLKNKLQGLGTVAKIIVNVVSAAIRALEPIINAAIIGINAIITAKNLLTSGPDTKLIPKVNFSNGQSNGSNVVSSSSLPSGFTSAPTPSITTAVTPVVTGATSAKTAPSITVPSVVSASPQPIPSDFSPAAFRAGEEASMAGVTINVNAPSAIDEEGFTRAVILALNNSERRSGGGSSQLIL